MAQFAIQLKEGQTVNVTEADTYPFEGPLTTFFSTGSNLQVIDSWSTRVASYRTADIVSIERCDHAAVNAVPIATPMAVPVPDDAETLRDSEPEIDLRGLVAV